MGGKKIMQRIEFSQGQTIFKQGDPSDLCYQIVTGDVAISVALTAGSKTVAELGPGDVFGEMGIIDSSPRSAMAVARKPTVCVAYAPDEIVAMLESNPKEAMAYIRALIRRIRGSNIRIASQLDH